MEKKGKRREKMPQTVSLGNDRSDGLFHLTAPDCPQEKGDQRPDTD